MKKIKVCVEASKSLWEKFSASIFRKGSVRFWLVLLNRCLTRYFIKHPRFFSNATIACEMFAPHDLHAIFQFLTSSNQNAFCSGTQNIEKVH
jgi:hypothetical protein